MSYLCTQWIAAEFAMPARKKYLCSFVAYIGFHNTEETCVTLVLNTS